MCVRMCACVLCVMCVYVCVLCVYVCAVCVLCVCVCCVCVCVCVCVVCVFCVCMCVCVVCVHGYVHAYACACCMCYVCCMCVNCKNVYLLSLCIYVRRYIIEFDIRKPWSYISSLSALNKMKFSSRSKIHIRVFSYIANIHTLLASKPYHF